MAWVLVPQNPKQSPSGLCLCVFVLDSPVSWGSRAWMKIVYKTRGLSPCVLGHTATAQAQNLRLGSGPALPAFPGTACPLPWLLPGIPYAPLGIALCWQGPRPANARGLEGLCLCVLGVCGSVSWGSLQAPARAWVPIPSAQGATKSTTGPVSLGVAQKCHGFGSTRIKIRTRRLHCPPWSLKNQTTP